MTNDYWPNCDNNALIPLSYSKLGCSYTYLLTLHHPTLPSFLSPCQHGFWPLNCQFRVIFTAKNWAFWGEKRNFAKNTRDYAPILSYIFGRPDAPEGAPSCHAFTCSPLPSPPSPVARASTPVPRIGSCRFRHGTMSITATWASTARCASWWTNWSEWLPEWVMGGGKN